jgi:hypothetical protein
VSEKPGCLRHVTLACYVLGQPGPAKETGTSATKYSGPRRTANFHYGAVAVGDAVLADRTEEHARELTVAVTPDDDEISGLGEGLAEVSARRYGCCTFCYTIPAARHLARGSAS